MLKYLRLLGNQVHSVFSWNKYREWIDGWMDGQMGVWVDGWMEGWEGLGTGPDTNTQTHVKKKPPMYLLPHLAPRPPAHRKPTLRLCKSPALPARLSDPHTLWLPSSLWPLWLCRGPHALFALKEALKPSASACPHALYKPGPSGMFNNI